MELKQYVGAALKYIVVEPDDYDPNREYPLIVLLHGFGSHMGDLASLASNIDRHHYLYVCPNAPISIDIGLGQVGYAWADFVGGTKEERNIQTSEAETSLVTVLEEVRADYRVSSVLVGGFSQGGMVTFDFVLPRANEFIGAFALSSRLEWPDSLVQRLSDSRELPIFMSHGTADTVIPVIEARTSCQVLESWGYTPVYKEYSMGHEINVDLIEDLRLWISDQLTSM